MVNYLSLFSEQLLAFLKFAQSKFPHDVNIISAITAVTFIKDANPKLLVKEWHAHVTQKFKTQIEAGEIDFFINHDYSNELTGLPDGPIGPIQISEMISSFREPVRNMQSEDQLKAMKFIQVLAKLSTAAMKPSF